MMSNTQIHPFKYNMCVERERERRGEIDRFNQLMTTIYLKFVYNKCHIIVNLKIVPIHKTLSAV